MKILCVYPLTGHQTAETQTFVMGSVSDWQPGTTELFVENLRTATKQSIPILNECFSFPVSLVPGNQTLRLTVGKADQLADQIADQILDQCDLDVCCLSRPVDYFENLDNTLSSWYPTGQVRVIPDYAVAFTGYIPPSWLEEEDAQEPVMLIFKEQQSYTHSSLADSPQVTPQEFGTPLRPCKEDGERDTRQAVFAELHHVDPVLPRRGFCLAQYAFQKSAAGKSFTASLTFKDRQHPLPVTIEVLAEPILAELKGTDSPDTKILARYGSDTLTARACPVLPGTLVQVPFFHQSPETAYSLVSPYYWVPSECITPLSPEPYSLLEPISVKLVTIQTVEYQKHAPNIADRVRITIPLSRQPLVEVISKPDGRLKITLCGVQHACDFIHFQDDAVLEAVLNAYIDCKNHDQFVLTLTLPNLAGYDWAYEAGVLCIFLQFWPESIQDLRILIDPGHGGEELGGISMTEVPEKTLNALCAGYLCDAFKTLGLNDEQIQFTRSPHLDATVTLSDRARIAKETRAHVLVSLHHNALPDGRDPQQYRGISTYYYHPFSRPLALRLYHALTQAANQEVSSPMPGYGVLFDSLAMTRITTAQAVLVELGFMTHPEDSILIHDPVHQALLMRALADAVVCGPAISCRHQSSGFFA